MPEEAYHAYFTVPIPWHDLPIHIYFKSSMNQKILIRLAGCHHLFCGHIIMSEVNGHMVMCCISKSKVTLLFFDTMPKC